MKINNWDRGNKKRRIGKQEVLFLYGKSMHFSKARAYCSLHSCYLCGNDIKEKQCNWKECKYLTEIVEQKPNIYKSFEQIINSKDMIAYTKQLEQQFKEEDN